MITHILELVVRTNLACIHASAKAKAGADTLRPLTNAEALSSVASTDDSVPSAQAKRARSGSSIAVFSNKETQRPIDCLHLQRC